MNENLVIRTCDDNVPTGNLSGAQINYMRERNRNPEFDAAGKSWKFEKVLPTDTKVTPWLISINGEYFVALQVPSGSRTSHRVLFYRADKKGKFENTRHNVYQELNMYVDLEAACDKFAQMFYQEKVEENAQEENF